MIYTNIQNLLKTTLFHAVVAFAVLCSLPVYAEVEIGAQEEVMPPAPNLTVNFTLNSSLTPEHSRYYKEIVEELLRNLPKRLALQGEHRTLVTGNPSYDKMKVIVYTPKDESEVINDVAEKEIQYFEIEFEVPEQLVDFKSVDGIAPALLESAIIVKKTERLEDFMKKVDMVREGGELALPNQPMNLDLSIVKERDQKMAVGGANISLSSFEAELARIAKEGKVTRTIMMPQDVTKAALPVARPQKPDMMKQSAVQNLSVSEKELTVRYFGDATTPLAKQNDALVKFAKAVKTSKATYVHLTSYTAPALPSGDDLLARRMAAVKNVLQQQGVSPSSITFSEIRLKSEDMQALAFKIVK